MGALSDEVLVVSITQRKARIAPQLQGNRRVFAGAKVMVRATLVTVLVLVSHLASAQSAAPELTPSGWQAKYSSARIESLTQQLAAGNRNTDDFWQGVRRAGTPLVESARPTDTHQLV